MQKALLTPNIPEASTCKTKIETSDDMTKLENIDQSCSKNVLIKGGYLKSKKCKIFWLIKR